MNLPVNDPAPTAAAVLQALGAAAPAQLPPSPLLRAQKMQWLIAQTAARGLANEAASAAVLPLRCDAGTWQELCTMQAAVLRRLQQQQQNWFDGLAALAQEQGQLKQANTLSKFVEQEYNLWAQFGALVASQAANFAGLVENVQVDYAYWIAQKAPGAGGA